MADIKLYAFLPKGYGPESYFVAAESKEKAEEAINNHLRNHRWPEIEPDTRDAELIIAEWRGDPGNAYYRQPGGYGGGTTYYILVVAKPGQVMSHDNA